jgi:competence ComEA-like helix-hairpin-helix protein
MNAGLDPIKNWFGFTRRERRSSFILLIIIAVIIGFRYAIPDSRMQIKDITGTISAEEILAGITPGDDPKFSSSFSNQKRSYQDTNRKAVYRVKNSSVIGKKDNQEFKSGQKVSRQRKPIVEINTGDSATLVTLPGIGPVLSSRIIKYRHLLGGFARTEQLREVYGLSEETFEMIKDKIFADSAQVVKISINTAGFKEIARLPYFEKYEVTAILKYRELKGKINNINDLIDNKVVTKEKGLKIAPYLKFVE